MSYSATMVLPCKCGAECHVVLECDGDPKALRTVPIFCCKCSNQIGQVPALAVWTHPTARDALTGRLHERDPNPADQKTAEYVKPDVRHSNEIAAG
jgi:hypothetical protein